MFVVGHSHCFEGIEDAKKACLVADNPQKMVRHIHDLCTISDLRSALLKEIKSFNKKYYERNREALMELFDLESL